MLVPSSEPFRARGKTLLIALGLVGLTLAAYWPLTSPYLIGGVDARWYTVMMQDALLQAREGSVPSLVGQTEYNWVGGVHPLRSAPIHFLLGQAIDAVTAHRLSVFAVQHAALLTSIITGVLSLFWIGGRFAPQRTVEVACVSFLYGTAPAWTSFVAFSDAYMSFTASAVLPWVFYGNARAITTNGERGLGRLAAALVGVWMCHPPLGLLATLTSLGLQTGMVIRAETVPWRPLARGAAWFGALGAYYFLSMSEIPPVRENRALHDLLLVSGIVAALVGLGRAATGRGKRWLGVWMAGLVICAALPSAWAGCLLLTGVVFYAVRRVGSLASRADLSPGLWWSLLFALSLSAAISFGVIPAEARLALGGSARGLDANGGDRFFEQFISQNTSEVSGRYRVGAGLSLATLWVLVLACRRRASLLRAFLAAAVVLTLLLVRLPWVSDFFVTFFPPYLARISNLPLDLRIVPIVASALAFACVLALSLRLGPRWVGAAVLASALLASVPGTLRFRSHLAAISGSETLASAQLRAECRPLTSFVYDLGGVPNHFSNGVMDPRLESRLLDSTMTEVRIGPDEIARAVEQGGAVERFELRYEYHPDSPKLDVFRVKPDLVIPAGASDLYRFEFPPDVDLRGWWFLRGQAFYREYHFPITGHDQAFGTPVGATRVLTLWNEGKDPLPIQSEFWPDAGAPRTAEGGPIGTVFRTRFDLERSPLRLRQVWPYVLEYASETGGALETYRMAMPGYRATVDGEPAKVRTTRNFLLAVDVPPGTHTVRLTYHRTARVWAGLCVTGGALALAFCSVRRRLAEVGEAPSSASA